MPEKNRRNIGLAPRQGVRSTETYNAAKAFESLRVDAYEKPASEIYIPTKFSNTNYDA
jgi:hypothetical protein